MRITETYTSYSPYYSCNSISSVDDNDEQSISKIRKLIRDLLLDVDPSKEEEEEEIEDSSDFSPLCAPEIRKLKRLGKLEALIKLRRTEIKQTLERWRPHIQNPDFLEKALEENKLEYIKNGGGGVYNVGDLFIIKPEDEGIFGLNNPKDLAMPFNDEEHRVRDYIPLYEQAQREVLASRVAEIVGLGHITPHVDMVIVENEEFHGTDKEKLCSAQDYIKDSKGLREWQREKCNETLDLQDFEDINVLMWLIHNTDGHFSNFLVHDKGNDVFGLNEIDNGLTFPEQNKQFYNALSLMREAQNALTDNSKALIMGLPVEDIVEQMESLKLEKCIDAFKERVEILQDLCQREDITIEDINIRMQLLGLKGREEAIVDCDIEELRHKLYVAMLEQS